MPKIESRDLEPNQTTSQPDFDYSKITVVTEKPIDSSSSTLESFSINADEINGIPVSTDVIQLSSNQIQVEIKPASDASVEEKERLRSSLEGVRERIQSTPGVVSAEFTPRAQAHGSEIEPNDEYYSVMWHYHRNGSHISGKSSPGGINLPQGWGRGTGQQTVVVAVLDTGLIRDHPDFAQRQNIVDGYDFISDPASSSDGDNWDNDPTDLGDDHPAGFCGPLDLGRSAPSWHGTHVAGTIGVGSSNNVQGISGTNWKISVQPIRVLGKCGGQFRDIAAAIRWAAGLPISNVPPNKTPARVINMSLGGAFNCRSSTLADIADLRAAINEATNRGVFIVASAGNNSKDARENTPAGCENVFSVAASDARGHLARYSAFGNIVDIMAPGGDVQRDDNGDNQDDGVLSYIAGKYALYNGTSMAAPHVSGVAALLLAQDAQLTPAKIRAILRSNAISRSPSDCPKPCGAGLLNADVGTSGPSIASQASQVGR